MNNEQIAIFISYSHENEIWLTEYLDSRKTKKNPKYLLGFWERSLRAKSVRFWYDREGKDGIHAADKWKERIFEEVDKSDIAILLITQDFVISPFIRDEELRHIVNRSREGKIEILPILLEPAHWEELEISSTYQLTPGKPTPLIEYFETSENEWKKVRLEILDAIEYAIGKVKKKRENVFPQPLPPKPKPEPAPKPIPEPPPTPTPGPTPSPEHLLFVKNGLGFVVGNKDSKEYSFVYAPGTVIQSVNSGRDGDRTWYQLRSGGDRNVWLLGDSIFQVQTDDNRVFFSIDGTNQAGYLVSIWGERDGPSGSLEEITIIDDMLGETVVKIDRIASMTIDQAAILVDKSRMTVQTRDGGAVSGRLKDIGNYTRTRMASFTMGPCLVTSDAVIALVRAQRSRSLTLNRIADDARPPLSPELIYWDRSQLKFQLAAKGATGHFDEHIRDSHIHFSEQSLGWMRVSIPMIKRITVDPEGHETPVVVETFAGNVYRGTCPEQFNLSGTTISFEKIQKKLVLDALDREVVTVRPTDMQAGSPESTTLTFEKSSPTTAVQGASDSIISATTGETSSPDIGIIKMETENTGSIRVNVGSTKPSLGKAPSISTPVGDRTEKQPSIGAIRFAASPLNEKEIKTKN